MSKEASHEPQPVSSGRRVELLEVLVYAFVPDRRQNIYFSAEPTWNVTPIKFRVTGQKKSLNFDVHLVRALETVTKLKSSEMLHLRQAVTIAVENLVAPLTIETVISSKKFDLTGSGQQQFGDID